ncbi:MAG TPA: hypothetical protein VN577_17690 [Terriglobales bacterium]|nr:hypothetical protein [Terriglobales bacterium]
MKATNKLVMAAAFGLAGLVAVPAASAQWYPQNDRGVYQNDNSGNYSRDSERQAYQQGYNDGISDRQNGPQRRSLNWKHDYDAQAYRDGYNDGYRGSYTNNRGGNGNGRWGTRDNNGRWGDRDRDRDHDRDNDNGRWGRHRRGDYGNSNGPYANGPWGNGSYGNGRYGYNNYGSQMGFQDGQYTGRLDAQNGQRYRPTEWKGYKEADHGMSQSGMNKQDFQNAYRQAYVQGYEQAYYQYRGSRY